MHLGKRLPSDSTSSSKLPRKPGSSSSKTMRYFSQVQDRCGSWDNLRLRTFESERLLNELLSILIRYLPRPREPSKLSMGICPRSKTPNTKQKSRADWTSFESRWARFTTSWHRNNYDLSALVCLNWKQAAIRFRLEAAVTRIAPISARSAALLSIMPGVMNVLSRLCKRRSRGLSSRLPDTQDAVVSTVLDFHGSKNS